jgi:acetyl-CoA carboxylase biotin carboxylase subunit
MVTGMDIVKESIRIAAGEPLQHRQRDIKLNGHAIECRINAEDPETLAPAPGQITAFNIPKGPGVRVDTAAHEQTFVSPFYDSMIAKVVVHGRDRAEAIARTRRSLDLMVVEGIRTNIPLLRRVVDHPGFIAGDYDTHLMDEILPNVGLRG